MKNAPLTDAQDYLLQEAEKHPNRIIDLYTGQDTGIQLMLLDAKERGIIRKVNGWWMYGDTNLGATDEAMLTFLKTPMNKPTFDAMKIHVYPEFAKHIQPAPIAPTVTEPEEDAPKVKKASSKK